MTQTAYHYTSLNAAQQILQTKTLRLTNIRCCNDGNEFVYGLKLLRESTNNPNHLPDIENSNSPFWIACFSAKQDDTAQWKSYGDDFQGVAIQFSLDQIQNEPQTLRIAKVVYDKATQLERLKEHVSAAMTTQYSYDLLHEICSMKQPAFSSENEIRLIDAWKPRDQEHWKHVSYQCSGNRISSFLTVKLPTDSVLNVMLGPRASSKTNEIQLKRMLQAYGWQANVICSEINVQ